ncbi:hypothetical protein CQA49_08610, partial [Helicobacter sp. MIT 00-7814]|uniref:hypothetical protein n=1 Tax=unclassified Helicobacter TaxID=2593540 RepID=UPI000E3795C3
MALGTVHNATCANNNCTPNATNQTIFVDGNESGQNITVNTNMTFSNSQSLNGAVTATDRGVGITFYQSGATNQIGDITINQGAGITTTRRDGIAIVVRDGVDNRISGTITNNGSLIGGSYGSGIAVWQNGKIGDLANNTGGIHNTSTGRLESNHYGISAEGGNNQISQITNDSGGVISGGDGAIYNTSAQIGSITNSGEISSSRGNAIYLASGNTTSITNSGTISTGTHTANVAGIWSGITIGTITNNAGGLIEGITFSRAANTITNAGQIANG